MGDLKNSIDSAKASIDVVIGFVEGTRTLILGLWEFIKDPFGFLKGIADPTVLVILAVLLLLKALGFDTKKYIKLTFVIYIIILVF